MTASEDRPWSRRVAPDDGEAGGRPTPLSPGSQSEPLSYRTVQRSPGAEGQFRPRRSMAERREELDLPPTEALPTQDIPRYRSRDFSPEGRRAVPSWAPAASASDAPSSERLDYHTLTRAEVRAAAQRYESDRSTGADGSEALGFARYGSAAPRGDAAGGPGAGSEASASGGAGVGGAGGGGSAPTDPPMSTPDQPLTRRQLRALREAQEAAEREGSASPGETAPDQGRPDGAGSDAPAAEATGEDRPPARPWAPVFYGESVRPDDRAQTADDSAAVEEGDDAEVAEESAVAEEAPSWSGSAPATFAIPVIADDTAAGPRADDAPSDDAASDDAAPDDAPSHGAPSDGAPEPASAPGLAAPSPESSTPELVEPPASDRATRGAEVGSAAPPGSTAGGTLEDWVAGLYGEQPSADVRPADLVEPPEPQRRDDATRTEPPAVLEDLFSPPPRDESRASEAPSAWTETPRPVMDPLEFLDAAPSAGDRVDLPAPADWAQPTVVGEPPVEPPGARAADEAIPVEAQEVPASEATELHPVVIDAVPLPAEPLPDAARTDPPRTGPVGTPTGHWAAQAAAEDSDSDPVAGRDVGGGHGVVTTNALVLPSIPSPELSGPLTTTGEIVITGSIDLPRSLSSTGAHPTQLDQSSLDHELDPGDQQVVSVDSQPVRAIKAVSTHTSTRGMMTSTKPHGNRGLTVLIVVTGGLAVVTLGVLAFGLANNAF